jgi:hypothetical protein
MPVQDFALDPMGNPRVFTPLVGLAILYFLLRRNDIWEQMT